MNISGRFAFCNLPSTTRVPCYSLSSPRVHIVAISEVITVEKRLKKCEYAPGVIVGVAVLCWGALLHTSMVGVTGPLLIQIKHHIAFSLQLSLYLSLSCTCE